MYYNRNSDWLQMFQSVVASSGSGINFAPNDLLRRTDELYELATKRMKEREEERVKVAIKTGVKTRLSLPGTIVPSGVVANLWTPTTYCALWLEWFAVHPDSQSSFEILD